MYRWHLQKQIHNNGHQTNNRTYGQKTSQFGEVTLGIHRNDR